MDASVYQWYLVCAGVNRLTLRTVRKITQSDRMLSAEWQKYDSDPWGVEWGDLLALIKEREKTYTAVVGTMKEALYVIHDDTLENTQSRALRAMIVINNGYDVSRCTI